MLQAKLRALDVRLKAVEKVVKHNATSLINLGGQKYVEPAAKDIVPIVDDLQEQRQVIESTIRQLQPTESSGTGESSPWWKVW